MAAADSRASMGGYIFMHYTLDDGYRFDMSIKEAAELARRTIFHATVFDGAIGGVASGELYYHCNRVVKIMEQEMVDPDNVDQEMADVHID